MDFIETKINIKDVVGERNIADKFNEEELNGIGMLVHETFNDDLESRGEYDEIQEKSMKLALQRKDPRQPGKSNTSYPLVIQSALSFGSDAYPALIKDGKVVRSKVIGSDAPVYQKDETGEDFVAPQTGQKQEIMSGGYKSQKGNRVADNDNYVITEMMNGWLKDFDRMLSGGLPVCGSMYKKVYYDNVRKIPVSDLMFPEQVVINVNAKDMINYPVTQKFQLFKHQIVQRQRTGDWLDVDIDKLDTSDIKNQQIEKPQEEGKTYSSEEERAYDFLEQHCNMDLDSDGYAEPYIIVIHEKSHKVMRIVARFREEGIIKNKDKEIVYIEAKNYFVKYPLIPNPNGQFYDIGYGELLYKINETIDSILNQLLDAGKLSNTTHGFMSKSLGLKGGDLTMKMGQWKLVDPKGMSLRENIVPFDHKEPSQTLVQLMMFLLEGGKEVANITRLIGSDVMPANAAPTTILAIVEEGMKQFKAIHKRIYIALKEEIKLIHDIIADDPDGVFAENYKIIVDSNDADFEKDYSYSYMDIVPVADLEIVTSMEKNAQANFLMSFRGDPNINQTELLKRVFETARIPDYDDLVVDPQPNQPDPMIEIEKAKLKLENRRIDIEEAKLKIEAATEGTKTKLEDVRALNEQHRIALARAEGAVKAVSVDANNALLEARTANTQADTMNKLADAEAKEAGIQNPEYFKQSEMLQQETKKEVENGKKEKRPVNDKV